MRYLKIALRVAAVSYIIWAFLRFGWDPFIPGFLIALAGFPLLYPALLRANLLKQFAAKTEYLDLPSEKWPANSLETVNRLTGEFESLGFVKVRDEIQRAMTKPSADIYYRLMEHQEHHCLGMIQVVALNRRVLAPVCTVFTLYGTEGNLKDNISAPPLADPNAAPATPNQLQGFVYATHNRTPLLVHELVLHPQMLRSRMTGATPKELLQSHLTRREVIGHSLRLAPDENNLRELYHAFQKRQWASLAIYIRRNNPWSQFLRALRSYKKRTEWLGDLETGDNAA